jgi:hypothetical protein
LRPLSLALAVTAPALDIEDIPWGLTDILFPIAITGDYCPRRNSSDRIRFMCMSVIVKKSSASQILRKTPHFKWTTKQFEEL